MAHLTAHRAAQGWGSGSTGTGGCMPFSDWSTLLLDPCPRRGNDIDRLSMAANSVSLPSFSRSVETHWRFGQRRPPTPRKRNKTCRCQRLKMMCFLAAPLHLTLVARTLSHCEPGDIARECLGRLVRTFPASEKSQQRPDKSEGFVGALANGRYLIGNFSLLRLLSRARCRFSQPLIS